MQKISSLIAVGLIAPAVFASTGPSPVMSYDEAQAAIHSGKIDCETENRLGTRRTSAEICDAALPGDRASMQGAGRTRFLLTRDGLFREECEASRKCWVVSPDGTASVAEDVFQAGSQEVQTSDPGN